MTYDKESLAAINARFLGTHLSLTDWDIDHANYLSERIESTRNTDRPMPGDIVEYTTVYGDFYPNAHIENAYEYGLCICEEPYIPFVSDVENDLLYTTSGGMWREIPRSLKRIGTRPKLFKDWGHCGACADGSIEFCAQVNVWCYAEKDPYFPYTTKEWDRRYMHYAKESRDSSGYHYYLDGCAFRKETEYLAWLATYHGVEFEGFWENQTVIFCYRKNSVLISKEEWDALDFPMDTRMMNGTIIDIKYRVDDETHTITEYRYTNSAEDCWNFRYRRPYEAALRRIENGEVILRKIIPRANAEEMKK